MIKMREVFEERLKREMAQARNAARWAKFVRLATTVGGTIIAVVGLGCVFVLAASVCEGAVIFMEGL